jgi:hypothetical protein
LAWASSSVLVATSPVVEIIRILRSDRLGRSRNRFLAIACLTRVRLYRAWRMLTLALTRDAEALTIDWNRS